MNGRLAPKWVNFDGELLREIHQHDFRPWPSHLPEFRSPRQRDYILVRTASPIINSKRKGLVICNTRKFQNLN